MFEGEAHDGLGGELDCWTLGGVIDAVGALPILNHAGRTERDVPGLLAFLRTIETGHVSRLIVAKRVDALSKPRADTFAAVCSIGVILGGSSRRSNCVRNGRY